MSDTKIQKRQTRETRQRSMVSRPAEPAGEPVRRDGPVPLVGETSAKKQAAVILEVLSGVRGTVEASGMMGVSLPRYYVLESRGIEGLVRALEPRPKGRQQTPEALVAQLQRDNARLVRELARMQALVRVAQRAIGVRERRAQPEGLGGNRRRGSRRRERAERVVALLRKGPEAEQTPLHPPAVP